MSSPLARAWDWLCGLFGAPPPELPPIVTKPAPPMEAPPPVVMVPIVDAPDVPDVPDVPPVVVPTPTPAPAEPPLAWGAKVSPAFRARVREIAKDLGCDPSDLMACMAFESGESFSPSIRNQAGSGATGLIQFMPSTARGLGTTTEALARMTAVEQLDYVRQYFAPYRGKLHTLADLYMAILWPAAVGKPEFHPLFVGPTIAYRQNAGLDRDKNGTVTKGEAARIVASRLAKGLQPPYVWTGDAV